MLTPSIVLGMSLTTILMAADWYIWDPRRRISQRGAPEIGRRPVADAEHIIHMPSASGRELIVSLPPENANRNVALL
jgi:hypothetical protein